jgi:hypothetical protein
MQEIVKNLSAIHPYHQMTRSCGEARIKIIHTGPNFYFLQNLL